MNILIIDDDSEGVEYLSTFLRLEGFTVQSTPYGIEGLKLIQTLPPDLIILDILLGELDGRQLCCQIRRFSEVPIMMLTAYGTDAKDEIQALGYGADDYLLKPIDFELLKARITTVLRRTTKATGFCSLVKYSDGYLTVDMNTQQVWVNNQYVCLSYLEYMLLEILIHHANQTLPALEIIEQLWPGQIHQDNTAGLRTYIKRLRKLIEPDPSKPQYIVNEYGLGYRFITPR